MSDIDELLAAADKEQQARQSQAGSRLGIGRKPTKLRWIVLAAILTVTLFMLARPFMPISEDIARSELNAVLDAAQLSVEEYLRVNRQLPDRVPDASLTGMVRFEPVADGYRLSASMNHVSLSRDQYSAQSGGIK